MANLYAVHSVGLSLVTYLRNAYPEPLRSEHPCQFRLISSGELAEPDDIGTAVTLYLYSISKNKYPQCKPGENRSREALFSLSIDLHYLIIVWANSALVEHSLIAWVMSQLNQHPILDMSTLSSEGGWLPNDQVHIVPTELSTEDLMRIWDALTPSYRLSVPYIARVIRIDPEPITENLPVVAKRFEYGREYGNE